jgi:hypothetical protein
MNRTLFHQISVFVCAAMLILSAGYVHAQTPGQIPMFVQPSTGACNNAGGNDCVDSVITQDSGGNIGIGTTAPVAKLHVAGGNLNLENSTATSGNILMGGVPFISNFGNHNAFFGGLAGNLTMTGYDNTAVGYQALLTNTTGSDNTANGVGALYFNTSGSSNTANGSGALLFNTGGGGNTAAGYDALFYNTTGQYNTAFGVAALSYNTSGSNNTASGAQALASNTSGSNNTAIGEAADVSQGDLTNATAIGYGAIVNASNKIRLGNTAVTVVEGPPYSTVSDKNAKENFKPVDPQEVLHKILGLRVTSWNYIGQEPKEFRHYGPVAQDFFAAFGNDGVGAIGSPTTITSTDMNGVLMLAIQALGKENETFRTQNDAFKAENAELRARIEALERLVKGEGEK